MPERFDITLGGKGYMVAANTYRRGLDHQGGDGRPPVRIVQREFAGGALRPAQGAERDTFWTAIGLLPDRTWGQGVAPGAGRVMTTTAALDPAAPRYWAVAQGRPYFATGSQLWRPSRPAVGSNPTNLYGIDAVGPALAGTITGLAADGVARLFVARAPTGYAVFDLATATYDLTATAGFTDVAWYAGVLWGSGGTGADAHRVYFIGTAGLVAAATLDSAITCLVLVRDALYVGTRGALWRISGAIESNVFKGTVEPVVVGNGGGFADDFAHLAGFGADIYTWISGEVQRFRTTSAGGANLVPTGLRAENCLGLCQAGGYLCALVANTAQYGGKQIWAFDGRGWWCLSIATDSLTDWQAIMPGAGYFPNADLIAVAADRAYGFQLRPLLAQPGLTPSGELVTSLWHGTQPDEAKSWLRVGTELGRQGGRRRCRRTPLRWITRSTARRGRKRGRCRRPIRGCGGWRSGCRRGPSGRCWRCATG